MPQSLTFSLKHVCVHLCCITAILVQVKWDHVHIQQTSGAHLHVWLGWRRWRANSRTTGQVSLEQQGGVCNPGRTNSMHLGCFIPLRRPYQTSLVDYSLFFMKPQNVLSALKSKQSHVSHSLLSCYSEPNCLLPPLPQKIILMANGQSSLCFQEKYPWL